MPKIDNYLVTLKLDLQWAVPKPRPQIASLKREALQELAEATLSLAAEDLKRCSVWQVGVNERASANVKASLGEDLGENAKTGMDASAKAGTRVDKNVNTAAEPSANSKSKLILEVPVRITTKEEIQVLNRDFRKVDEPTNILSFPCDESAWDRNSFKRELGDLVICADVVTLEAVVGGIKLEDHWAHILVHGLLHLLGLDHLSAKPRRYMQHLEGRILSICGWANPHPDAAL